MEFLKDDWCNLEWTSWFNFLDKAPFKPNVTMIHLDSLVWQVAAMHEKDIRRYFEGIGASRAGMKLCSFLRGEAPTGAPASPPPRGNLSRHGRPPTGHIQERVVCFLPCCGSKRATGNLASPGRAVSREYLAGTWPDLVKGRGEMSPCIKKDSRRTSALYLYTGSPYQSFPDKEGIAGMLDKGLFRLYIISAGYGVLDALEPALDYDAVLQGKVASLWKGCNLTGIIADLILQEQPSRVYGFFAGNKEWASPGSRYRYFYTEGVKAALEKGLQAEAGCFYRREGMGVKAILGGLGRTFLEFLGTGFNDSYRHSIIEQGRRDGQVIIGYDEIRQE